MAKSPVKSYKLDLARVGSSDGTLVIMRDTLNKGEVAQRFA
jgi:hypothetical protein